MVDVLERNREWNQKGYRVRFVKKSDNKEFLQVLLKDKTRYLVVEPGEQFQIVAEWKLFTDVDNNYEAAKRTDARYARIKSDVVNDIDDDGGFTADTYPNVAMLMINGKQASVKYLTDKLAPDSCKMFRSCTFSKVRTEDDKYCALKFNVDGKLPTPRDLDTASESLSLLEQLDPSLESCSVAVYFAYSEKDDPRWYRKEDLKRRTTPLERPYGEADDTNPGGQQRRKVRLVEGDIEPVEAINVRPIRCLDSWFNSRIDFKYHTREVFHEVTKGAVPLLGPGNPGSAMPNPLPKVHYVDKTFDELKRKLVAPPPTVISIDDDDDDIIIVSESFVGKRTNTGYAGDGISVPSVGQVKSEPCSMQPKAEITHSNSPANSFTVEAQIPAPPGVLTDSSARAEIETSNALSRSASADHSRLTSRHLLDSGNQELQPPLHNVPKPFREKQGYGGHIAPHFDDKAASVGSDDSNSQRALAASSADASEDSGPNKRVMRMTSMPATEANYEVPKNPYLSELRDYAQADIEGTEKAEVCIEAEEPVRHTGSSTTLSAKSEPYLAPSQVQAENDADADPRVAPMHQANRELGQHKIKSDHGSDVRRDRSASLTNIPASVKMKKEEPSASQFERGETLSAAVEGVHPVHGTRLTVLPENTLVKNEERDTNHVLESERKQPKVKRERQNGDEELHRDHKPVSLPENIREVKKEGSRASKLFSDTNFCEESGAAFFEAARKKPKREPIT
eukprot:CAMPEP_0184698830 /NCGR_PEP_ID=MMETSP0313-20130426/5305_1 /TAXON_ID=2792 /ORGANISM="Porphyridium aerugineum, Strain SAG 1380-2" /LENGTH=736 /DNA_ID=CAMNT_0027157819 /DNA_START=179 /DNA_END=2389 /DNA_ORIENTATION=+